MNNKNLISKAQKIKLVISDVDGVLTDGKIYFFPNQHGGYHELKSFNTKDGVGIKLLQKYNIKFALLTGRSSDILLNRARELNIEDVIQNSNNKMEDYEKLKNKYNLSYEEICFIGDDLPDLAAIQASGLGVTVADGAKIVKDNSDFITTALGGCGAVREVCDLILHSKNHININYDN